MTSSYNEDALSAFIAVSVCLIIVRSSPLLKYCGQRFFGVGRGIDRSMCGISTLALICQCLISLPGAGLTLIISVVTISMVETLFPLLRYGRSSHVARR